jgi:thymidine kinase
VAKLYFYYSTMNAGKSTALLQASHNYRERGLATRVYTAAGDVGSGATPEVHSRIGIRGAAHVYDGATDLYAEIAAAHRAATLGCVLLDEAQFLTRRLARALGQVADELDVPVLCYGLRTDFRGELFEGSAALLAWADNLVELKTICHCGKKATMVVLVAADGRVERAGAQVEIGGNERYVSVCRRHFLAALESGRA